MPAALAESGGSGIDGNWLLKGVGILAAITVLGALLLSFTRPHGSDDGGTSSVGPVHQLAAVCDSAPKPITSAAPFSPEPGLHRVEAIVVPPPDGSIGEQPTRIELGDRDGWGSPTAAELRAGGELQEVELVGCYVVTRATKVRDCPYGTPLSGSEFSLPLWTTSGRVVVREAKTGEEVFRTDVAEVPGGACPAGGTRADPRIVQHPDAAIRAALRLVNDGTDPSLPIAEQAARVCSQELFRAAIPATTPTEAVTVMVRTAEDGPFRPLGPTSPVAVPPELAASDATQAGTVLCVTAVPGSPPSTRPVTLATGATNFGQVPAGVVVAPTGQTRLPWEAPADSGLRAVLAAPRT